MEKEQMEQRMARNGGRRDLLHNIVYLHVCETYIVAIVNNRLLRTLQYGKRADLMLFSYQNICKHRSKQGNFWR